MSEKSPSIERIPLDEPTYVRLEYGAVPLDPWKAVEPDGSMNYSHASTKRISRKLKYAMMSAMLERDFVESPEFIEALALDALMEPSTHSDGEVLDTSTTKVVTYQNQKLTMILDGLLVGMDESDARAIQARLAKRLYDFMEVSLYDSQMRRIDLNPTLLLDGVIDDEDLRVIHAKNGTATPSDLLSLLVDYPNLESLELAKLSHPLDSRATVPMVESVSGALVAQGGDLLHDEKARYKLKRLDPTIPAAIVLRKQVISRQDVVHGIIEVVQRQSFLVRGDEGVSPDEYLSRKIKNPDRIAELEEKIESYVPDLDKLPGLRWLQPQATSYYAKYVARHVTSRQ
jgi:hypothetical protein